MDDTNFLVMAKRAVLAMAEIKVATEAFDQGDTNVFDALDAVRVAVEAYADREVSIRCRITSKQLLFEIQDQGLGFDPRTLNFSDPLHIIPTGRGILIITSFMDEVFWNATGNMITMIKYLRQSELVIQQEFPCAGEKI